MTEWLIALAWMAFVILLNAALFRLYFYARFRLLGVPDLWVVARNLLAEQGKRLLREAKTRIEQQRASPNRREE